MYVAIIKSLDDDAYGKDLSGVAVPMALNSMHMVSKNDLGFYKDHPDVFEIVSETDFVPLALVSRYRTGHKFGNVMTVTPISKLRDTALSATVANIAFGSHIEWTAESAYSAVRYIFPNNTNAIPGVSAKMAVAAAAGLDPAGGFANADGLTQNNSATWTTITFGGAGTFNYQVAPGVFQPVYAVSDWMQLTSLTRTDAATQSALHLNFVRVEIPASATVYNIPTWAYGSDQYALNGFTGNWGNDVSNLVTNHRFVRQIFQNAAIVTTPTALTQNTLQCGIPVIMQYATLRAGMNIAVFGDSIQEGSSPSQAGVVATRCWNIAQRAAYDLSTPDFPISVANFGWGTSTSAAWFQRFLDLIKLTDSDGFPVYRPDVLMFSPFGQNDGTPTAAITETQLHRAVRVLAICKTMNILPIMVTGSLVNTYSATDDAFRAALVTKLKLAGVGSDYIILDTAGAWGTGASPNQWAAGMAASDGAHPSDAAKNKAAAVLKTILSYISAAH